MTEEQKAKMKAVREAKKLSRVEITSKEADSLGHEIEDIRESFDDFKSEVLQVLDLILKKEPEETGAPQKVEQINHKEHLNINLPENYQAIFEEYFDPKDGFEAEMSYEGNISFTIIVPMKFSNTTEAWRTYYKVDRRTKVLKQGNIEGGIKEWCEKVAKNLKYNKNLLIK
jgi:hypothetical protein